MTKLMYNTAGLPDVGVFGCKSRNLQDEHAGVFESNKLSQDW